jgi:TonB family protein
MIQIVMLFVLTMTLAAQVPPPYEEVYRAGGNVSAPTVFSKIDPEYSEAARKAKLKGSVILSLIVGSDGIPSDIKVMQSLDHDLDLNSVEALRKWRFHPGRKSGQPVAVQTVVEMTFQFLTKLPVAPGVSSSAIEASDRIDESLPAPVLTSPRQGESFDLSPRLLRVSWEAAPGAASYVVEWDYADVAGWHSEIDNHPRMGVRAAGTTALIEFAGAQRGRCRVWAVNQRGVRGTPSAWREFHFTR